MKIFDNFNESTECPICGTKKEGKSVLIPIDGTAINGVEELLQVHLDCISLRCLPGDNDLIFYQRILNKE